MTLYQNILKWHFRFNQYTIKSWVNPISLSTNICQHVIQKKLWIFISNIYHQNQVCLDTTNELKSENFIIQVKCMSHKKSSNIINVQIYMWRLNYQQQTHMF